jgi:hypothetical protein
VLAKGGSFMHKVKVVKASTATNLEDQINDFLQTLEGEYVDIKVSGAYDGKDEIFVAVIVYKV